jgi:hypothetical protein
VVSPHELGWCPPSSLLAHASPDGKLRGRLMPRCPFFFAGVLAMLCVTEVSAQELSFQSPIQGSRIEVASPPTRAARSGSRPGSESSLMQDPPNLVAFENLATVRRAAGTIFRGTVLSVQAPKATRGGEMETVQVTFRIDDAFRGVRRGQSLTIREWRGLWLAGERYRVGERVVLFLYPPSKLGLTSPVGGAVWTLRGGSTRDCERPSAEREAISGAATRS